MILAGGKIYDSKEQNRILRCLENRINRTLEEKELSVKAVIAAFDRLSRELLKNKVSPAEGKEEGKEWERRFEKAAGMISGEMLEYRLKTELGLEPSAARNTCPPGDSRGVRLRQEPLGTLFHITAGNTDGLSVFSAMEGLLTGNINLLKLPRGDEGVSLQVLHRLTQIEPQICDYLYVFDTPSEDRKAIRRMMELADGIVVWGGDEAVISVRRLAPAGVKLIEWGHKLGFAYLSGCQCLLGHWEKDAKLRALAEHIISTKQLPCSSCQTIFLDTESMEEVHRFCRDFLPYLESAAKRYRPDDAVQLAEETLRSYHRYLEQILKKEGRERQRRKSPHELKNVIWGGYHCSLTACTDSRLELSGQFGHCLVKRLPKEKMLSCLRKQKGYLQTAGLICPDEERADFTRLLCRCGVTRITTPGNLSEPFVGEGHDGEYPLRRYMRFTAVEQGAERAPSPPNAPARTRTPPSRIWPEP